MVQISTIVRAADNAGALTYKCLTVMGGHAQRYARLGDIIRMVPQQVLSNQKVKRRTMYYGLVVRSRRPTKRPDGTVVRFNDNAVLTLDDKHKFMGTRVAGVVAREIRAVGGADNKYKKMLTLASGVV